MRGQELVDNMAAALALDECAEDECMCRQEPLRLAVQAAIQSSGAFCNRIGSHIR